MEFAATSINYTLADTVGTSFSVRFPRCSREPESWKQEVFAAARTIANKTTKPLWLCSSGGIDSEIMCRAFYDQGIHFSVLTIEHAGKTNNHDIRYAKKWCAARGIVHNVITVDMHTFLSHDIRSYATQSFITKNVFRYFQIRLLEEVERLGGYAVLGGGEQLYRVDPTKETLTPSDVFLEFEVGYAVPLEWCKRNDTAHEPYFYFSTPELMLSFLRIPLVSALLHNPDVFRSRTNALLCKRLVYNTVWPDTEPRKKYTGYEHILETREEAQEYLAQEFAERIQVYRLPVDELIAALSPTS